MTNTYKHSGSFGDLIYSLPLVKHFGGGEFYLHLNQIDWIGLHYYGSKPIPFHQGRLTQQDYEFIRTFMLAQPYISTFNVLDKTSEISHNLDRFRPLFVGHPGNYIDIYASAFGIDDPAIRTMLRTTPWLLVPSPKRSADKSVVINRTARWVPSQPPQQWELWKHNGIDKRSIFLGLPEEYEQFKKQIGWDIPYQPTNTMLELAEYIAGADKFIGNQSVALSIAIGLGKEYHCEERRDIPRDRSECYFVNQSGGYYF